MDKLLERGVEEIIEKPHLKERLKKGDKLRVKLGIDPTAKDLHLGHTVVLRKLKQFQDTGHTAVFIIGDFTAAIGDPSGKSETRPSLTKKEIEENMKSYLKEAGKVISIKKAEVHYNSEWYKKKRPDFLMELTGKFTIARMLERDDFQKRLRQDIEISLLEILYPIFQGYDSVEVRADLELGGTDQKFNLLMGRKVQKRYGQPEQDILTVPLLEGLDGARKMSKSLGNYVGLSEKPEEMFGKTMSLPDGLMIKYFTLLTDISEDELERLKKDRLHPADASMAPKEWKERLAVEIVKMYHGEKEAQKAREEWEKVFSGGELPENMMEYEIKEGTAVAIIDSLAESKIVSSKTEAKRLLGQKAVAVNGETVTDWKYRLKKGDIVKVGPRRFFKAV